MNSYLSPSVEQVLPFLAQTCDELTKQVLIRELTRHTEDLCKGDPDLADTILEGKKTLPDCVRYVLEQAAKVVAKNIDAMTEAEFKILATQQVRGKKATMAGAAVSAEDAFKWASEYYYGGSSVNPDNVRTATEKKDDTDKTKKSSTKKKPADSGTNTGSKSAPPADAGKAKVKNAMDGGTQITMAGFTNTTSESSAA